MRPRWRLTQFPLCRKRSYGRTHSSVLASHTDTGTSGFAQALALLTEIKFLSYGRLITRRHGVCVCKRVKSPHLQDFDPFIIDLRVGRSQEGEKKQRKDEGQNAVDGRSVREPIDDAEGGPEEDGDSDAARPPLERQRRQTARRLQDRVRLTTTFMG